jgi:hypothetical protein
MRRAVIATGLIALLCVTLALSSFLWVSRAVDRIDPWPTCLSERDRHQWAVGNFPAAQQDRIVAMVINFQQGVPRSHLWWHLRGAVIHRTYLTFWSRDERALIFARLAPRMRACPAGLR